MPYVLPEITNFRDAGGHATGDLAPGVVFRSSELDRAHPAALTQLPSLGISDVFDLRTEREIANARDHLPSAISLRVLDIMADGPSNGASAIAAVFSHHINPVTVEQLNSGLGDGRALGLMIDAYTEFITFDSAHRGYRDLILGILKAPGASVVHCTAGKDRTGWGIALIQHLAGVDDEEIIVDYLASNEAWSSTYEVILDEFEAAGGQRESLADILWVRREYLEAAIDAVEATYDTRHRYLRDGLGLDGSTITQLQRRLGGANTQASAAWN